MTSAEFQTLRKKANIAQHGLGYTCWEGQLERFAKLVRNAALEEAAQKCDQMEHEMCYPDPEAEEPFFTPEDCAKAIRNLKEPTL